MRISDLTRDPSTLPLVSRFLSHRRVAKRCGLAVIVGALWAQVTRGLLFRFPTQYSDSSGMADIVLRSGSSWKLASNYLYAPYPYLFTAKNSLTGGACSFIRSSGSSVVSMWPIHPYTIALPLGWISRFTSVAPETVAATAIAGSFVLGLVCVALFLRSERVRSLWIVALVVSLVLWPALHNGLLGQMYFDRLLFGPLVLALLSTYKSAASGDRWSSIASACVLLCAAVSERTGVVTGLCCLAVFVGSGAIRRWKTKGSFLLIASCTAAIGWSFVWNTWVQDSPYYSQIDIATIIHNLKRLTVEPGTHQLWVFVLILLPMVLAGVGNPKTAPTMFVAIAPNLALTVGGAELTGFQTHYHQMYLPVVVACATFGIVRIDRLLVQRGSGRAAVGRALSLAPLVFVLVAILIWSSVVSRESMTPVRTGALQSLGWYDKPARASVSVDRTARRAVAEAITRLRPSAVSAPESLSPALFQKGLRNYSYVPIGAGTSTVVAVPFTEAGQPVLFPYGRPGWADASVESCVIGILVTDYVEEAELPFFGYTLRLFRRYSGS